MKNLESDRQVRTARAGGVSPFVGHRGKGEYQLRMICGRVRSLLYPHNPKLILSDVAIVCTAMLV